MKRGGPLKRRGQRESAVEKRAREAFEEAVLAKGKCACADLGPCEGRMDAHHVIPKQYLRHIPHGRWMIDLLAVVWDPDNGVPICRRHHNLLTIAALRLTPEQLRPENINFAVRLGLGARLEREVPGFVLPEVFVQDRTEEDSDGQ